MEKQHKPVSVSIIGIHAADYWFSFPAASTIHKFAGWTLGNMRFSHPGQYGGLNGMAELPGQTEGWRLLCNGYPPNNAILGTACSSLIAPSWAAGKDQFNLSGNGVYQERIGLRNQAGLCSIIDYGWDIRETRRVFQWWWPVCCMMPPKKLSWCCLILSSH